MSHINRIKSIAKTINGPIMENFGPRHDSPFIDQHKIVKHTTLSIPTTDETTFKGTAEPNSGHDKRPADNTSPVNDPNNVDPSNMPPVETVDDRKSSAQLADLFHSLSTRRGILKAKIAAGDTSEETTKKMFEINARIHNVAALRDTAKRFED